MPRNRSQNYTLQWQAPKDDDGNDYPLRRYEMYHNFPGYDNPSHLDPRLETHYISIPEGLYHVGIQAVSMDGNKSEKVTHNFESGNALLDPTVSRNYGVPYGGIISTNCFINETTGIFSTESTTGWSFASAGTPRWFRSFQNGNANRYSQDCSDIESLDFSSMTEDEAAIKSHYIFFDASDSDNPLKLIKYEDSVYSTNNTLGLGYFYDAGTGDDGTDTDFAEDTFVTKTGTASIAAENDDVVGTSTLFTTEYAVGDIIYFNATKAAIISNIESDLLLQINKTFATAITNSAIKKQGYTVDRNYDAALYQVRNESGTFKISRINLIVDESVFNRSRIAILQATPNLLNFDSTPTLTTEYTNDPEGLVLTATAQGFVSPKFKITGTGFNNSEINSNDIDTSFQNPSSGRTYVKNLSKVDAFVTTDLDFTVTITEAADEINTDLQSTHEITIPFIRDGSGSGSTGQDAKVVQLTVDDYSIIYDADGSNPSPSGNMTLTASSQNFTNPYFKFTGDGINNESSFTDGTDDSDTFTFEVPNSHFATPKSLRVGVAEAAAATTEIAFDSISITAVKPGATGPRGIDGMTFVCTNEAHTFHASKTGVVSSYTGSGTIIEVYEGGTELVYDGTGTSNSRWKTTEAVADVVNITVGSKTAVNNSLTVGDHSGVASGTNDSKIIYTITGKRADGTSFTAQAQQSFTKSSEGADGVDGRVVNLTMADQTFEYNTNGLVPTPSDAIVTATALNTTGTIYYQFIKNDVDGPNTTSNTYTYGPPTNYSSMPEKIEVRIREGSSSGTIKARDQITASGLQAGSDAIITVLSNEAHTLPVTAGGTVTYTGSGTDITVWLGTTQLNYGTGNSQFQVTSATGSDINVSTPSTVSSNIRRFGVHNGMAVDVASITYSIAVKDTAGVTSTFTRVQSFAKSHQGTAGDDGRAVNLTMADQTFEYNTNGLVPSPSNALVTSTAMNTTGDVYYEFLVNDVTDQNTTAYTYTYEPPTNYTSMPEKIEVRIREGSSSGTIKARDQITASGLQAGSDAIITVLSNEAHTLPVTAGGAVTYTGSGTDITVWLGTTQLDYGTGNSQFQVATPVATNISITSASTVSNNIRRFAQHQSMTADTASVAYSIAVKDTAGVTSTFTRVQSLAKSHQGTAGLNSATVSLYRKNTSNSSAPAAFSGTFTYNFATGAVTGGTLNSWTTAVPDLDPGEYAWVRQATASGSGSTDSIVHTEFSLPPVVHSGVGDNGLAGKQTANGYLYYNTQQASAPGSAPSDSGVTYTFSTGVMAGGVIGIEETDWSLTAPEAATGTVDSKMYYVYWNAEETTAGDGTASPDFDSTIHTATNFTGLVRFNGTNELLDGLGTNNKLSFGSGGTTTIDGDAITTGTVAAAYISTDLFRVGGNVASGSVGGWDISSTAIQGGTGVYIASGKTAYGQTTAGFWLGNDETVSPSGPKFDIGNNTKYLRWTGEELEVKGSITLNNASSTDLSTFNNNSGWTNDTAADAAQTTANSKTTLAAANAAVNANVYDIAGGVITIGTLNASKIESDTNTIIGSSNKFAFNGDTSYSGYSTVVGAEAITSSTFAGLFFGNGGTEVLGAQSASAGVHAAVFANSASMGALTYNNRVKLASDDEGSIFEDDSGKWCELAHPDHAGYFKDDIKSRLYFLLTKVSGGSGYTSTPTVTFTNAVGDTTGTGAAATSAGITIYNGQVIVISLYAEGIFDGRGSRYTAAPTVEITGGGGTGAEYTATLTHEYVKICTGTHALYYEGAIGPFTGSHDALLSDSETCEIGDILVDQGVAYAKSVSDVITNVTRSTSTNQKSVVGVFVQETPTHVPVPLSKEVVTNTGSGPSAGTTSTHIIDPIHDSIMENKAIIAMNSVGEGQVNVCGENGNIEIGDLISSSSTTGKGMKQDDDIVRSCTVGKARETVTFASASSTAQIACIYMCG